MELFMFQTPGPLAWRLVALAVVFSLVSSLAVSGAAPFTPAVAEAATTERVPFLATADAYVTADSSGSNFGVNTRLRTDSTPSMRVYFKFNLTELPSNYRKVVLRVFGTSSNDTGYTVHRVGSNSWGEKNITWETAPNVNDTVLARSGVVRTGVWNAIDVTSAISGPGVYTFALKTASGATISVASRETTTKPRLVVHLDTAPQLNGYFLAPNGNDGNPGTEAKPWRTFGHAMQQLRPGDTLYARGGTYVERAMLRGSDLTAGTSSKRITVKAYPGERPIIKGQFWMSNANFWTIDGINVTWDPNYVNPEEHMVRFYGGHDMVYQNAEIWGARSYAGILLTNGAYNFNINHMYIHDTRPSNDMNQDHLIYVGNSSRGVIEYNLLVASPNGRGIKIGNSSSGSGTPYGVIVRYNTIVDSAAGNIGFSYDAHDNEVYRNVMVNAGPAWTSVAAFTLTGARNVVSNNIGWGAVGLIALGTPLIDGGSNRFIDPQLNSNYRPQNPALYDSSGVLRYGHLAGT
jgi:hypothetical protein